jgi:NAD(P)-dependent dehydrogenase (short-subunit alcohol dehydrogenase family)
MNLAVYPQTITTPSATLAGLRVLVTGARSGIGHAIAEHFLAEGAIVGAHHRGDVPSFDAGNPAMTIKADLCDHAARRAVLSQFVGETGGIDVLVNNAGAVPSYAHFSEIDDAVLTETFEINALAPFRLIGEAWPHMAAQGRGRIINIGTAAVKYGGSPSGVHYVAAKGALDAMTVAFAKAGAAAGIRVNGVRCGVVDSGMHLNVPGYTDAQFAKRAAQVPVGRAGRTEEVAALVGFLASPEADYITGQLIDIAGGD